MIRLIIGCGYVGTRVAQDWLRGGDTVFALTRSVERADQLRAWGIQPIVGDVTAPSSLSPLPRSDCVLWTVGYDRLCGKPIHQVQVDGLGNVLASLDEGTGRVIYISSTGVYGQQDGSWVDESSACQPQRPGGEACLAAERLLCDSQWARRALILRLGGIYGPERLPQMKKLAAGQPLHSAPDTLLNLIHVDDAVAAVLRAADLPLELPRTYLVVDGHPVLRRTFYGELARQANLPPPEFKSTERLSSAGDRSGSHKRVANGRMVRELGVKLRYPSFREGLAAIAVDR